MLETQGVKPNKSLQQKVQDLMGTYFSEGDEEEEEEKVSKPRSQQLKELQAALNIQN